MRFLRVCVEEDEAELWRLREQADTEGLRVGEKIVGLLERKLRLRCGVSAVTARCGRLGENVGRLSRADGDFGYTEDGCLVAYAARGLGVEKRRTTEAKHLEFGKRAERNQECVRVLDIGGFGRSESKSKCEASGGA